MLPSFFLLLLFKFIAINIVTSDLTQAEPPQNVILRRLDERNQVETSINLKLVFETYLANENLPVWIARTHTPNKLESLPHVMEDIGPFYMYRDVENCAAAIYFQKRQEFDGTIRNHDIIYHVPYDAENGMIMASKENILKSGMNHPETISVEQLNNDISHMTGIYEDGQAKRRKLYEYYPSRGELPDIVYIEILVMVNHDLAKTLKYDYAAIVSYVLITFNSVDTLYATIEKPRIKINIAGIIIAEEYLSFSKLIEYNCFQYYGDSDNKRFDAVCMGDAIKFTLKDYQDTIALDSYDLVVFLTDSELQGNAADDYDEPMIILLGGYTVLPDENIYNGYKLSPNDMRIVIAYNFPHAFQFYSIIAHEMAHAFNVFHDQGEFRDDNGMCIANLMKSDGSFCEKCLFFSDSSREQLTRFFSSRDGCIFYNKPKSLYRSISAPQLFWTEDQQCRCYGYEHSFTSVMDKCVKGFFGRLQKTENNCGQRLQCIRYENGKPFIDRAAYVMDGTPCKKKDKVCWKSQCETFVKSAQSIVPLSN